MVGVQYQIRQKALEQVINSSKTYVCWAGFAPVSPEIKEKILDSREIIMRAIRQAELIETQIRKRIDYANKRYVRHVAKLLKQSTGIPANTIEEFISLPEAYEDVIQHWYNSEFEEKLRNATEIKLEAGVFNSDDVRKLVHCPRLEAIRLTQAKGRWYDVKMIDASKNEQGFAVTLYTPAPKFSKNYQMLKQFAVLEQLVMQSAK